MSESTMPPEDQPSPQGGTNHVDETADFRRHFEQRPVGLVREFWEFLVHEKRWWLVPIVCALLLISLFVLLGGTAAAPFIYTLF